MALKLKHNLRIHTNQPVADQYYNELLHQFAKNFILYSLILTTHHKNVSKFNYNNVYEDNIKWFNFFVFKIYYQKHAIVQRLINAYIQQKN